MSDTDFNLFYKAGRLGKRFQSGTQLCVSGTREDCLQGWFPKADPSTRSFPFTKNTLQVLDTKKTEHEVPSISLKFNLSSGKNTFGLVSD